MKCIKAERLISDYVDGLLSPKKTAKLELHLRNCARCRVLLKDMKAIIHTSGELEAVEPPGNLWPEIKSRITSEPKRRIWNTEKYPRLSGLSGNFSDYFRNPATPVFSAMAAMLFIFIVTQYIYTPVTDKNFTSFNQSLVQNELKETEEKYLQAISSLKEVLKNQKSTLPPELEKIFEENLEIIDQAILACKKAMEDQPDNIASGRYLMLCYKKKYEILNEIKDLTLYSG